MSITVRLFARLREQLGCEQLLLELGVEPTSVNGIIRRLGEERGADWTRELSADNVICAIDREVVAREQTVRDGNEVAFFPPVTGG